MAAYVQVYGACLRVRLEKGRSQSTGLLKWLALWFRPSRQILPHLQAYSLYPNKKQPDCYFFFWDFTHCTYSLVPSSSETLGSHPSSFLALEPSRWPSLLMLRRLARVK